MNPILSRMFPAAIVLACMVPDGLAQGVVRGEATFRERIMPGPDAVFEAKLEDVSRADAPAEVLGTARIESAGAPPYRFEIAYDASRIRPQGRYSVRASLAFDGRLQFVTDQIHPVLTGGAGETVSMVMRRAAPPKAGRSFEGTYWKVVRIGERVISGPRRPNEAHLVFDPEGMAGRVAGAGGCNRLMGGYRREGSAIAFEQMAGTMMACHEGMDVEQQLNQALQKVAAWRISGAKLELLDAQGALLVRLQARSQPPRPGAQPAVRQ